MFMHLMVVDYYFRRSVLMESGKVGMALGDILL